MIQVICFSRARPLQLHGYLTSLFKHWEGDFRVSVLAKVDDEYYPAYKEATAASEFPNLTVLYEDDFATTLKAMIAPDIEYTCFGCDDVVYVAPVKVCDVEHRLGTDESLLGVSLRLGERICRDMFGSPLPQPDFSWAISGHTVWKVWDFTTGVGDWGYPWEVLGTVYRTEFVKCMVDSLGANSPSQLEERGSRGWAPPAGLRRRMAAYTHSRLVVPTVNVIQREFTGNGIKGTQPLSPEFLLECWNNGLRLDTERYAWMEPESWRVPEFYLKRVT